jgi:RNA polymerase sigma factor (sigma-70 family)
VRTASIPARFPSPALYSKRLLALAGDAKLVEQMRRGNEAAFEVAFERHGAGILGFCRHMLGSPEEAEEVVQHTFAAAFGELQRGGDRQLALRPWLYTVARNRCVSLLRSRREQATEEIHVPTAGLAEEVERRAELRDVLRDLRELPRAQREALLLAEAGDLSHAEVAKVLGCEVAKVKALVFRARSGLIQRRIARETPCSDIREQLANLGGGSLRRSPLRHHLRRCEGCRAYGEQVRLQRRMLAAALPVAPSLGLKSSVLGAVGLGGGSVGGGLAAGVAGVGAGASASFGGATVAKVALVGVLATGGAVAGKSAVDDTRPQRAPAAPAGPADRAAGRPGHEADARGPGEPPARGTPLKQRRSANGDGVGPGPRLGRPERAAGGRAAPDPGRGTAPVGRRDKEKSALPPGLLGGVSRGPAGPATKRAKGHGPADPAAELSKVAVGTHGGAIDRPRPSRPTQRGPVETPPADTPLKRGPPDPKPPPADTPVKSAPPAPKPPPERRVTATEPPAAHGAPSAVEPAPQQAPQARGQEKAPKE